MVTIQKPARLHARLLLARKGEASPAIAVTSHNNPALAWGGSAHPEDYQPQAKIPAKLPPIIAKARLRPDSFFAETGQKKGTKYRIDQDVDTVVLTMRVGDETYLRLKYLAQQSGRSTHQVLGEALHTHLVRQGLPQSRKLIVKKE